MLYGVQPWGDSPIDFEGLATAPSPRGHVIAARITSENPDEVTVNIMSLKSSCKWYLSCSQWIIFACICRVSNPVQEQYKSWTFAATRTCGATSAWQQLEVCTSLQTPSLDTVSHGERTGKKPFRMYTKGVKKNTKLFMHNQNIHLPGILWELNCYVIITHF